MPIQNDMDANSIKYLNNGISLFQLKEEKTRMKIP